MKQFVSLTLLLISVAFPALGQETNAVPGGPSSEEELREAVQIPLLTREDAVGFTLENNLGIQVSRNQREIDENNASLLNSGYLPTVSAIGGGSIDVQDTEGVLANGETRTADGAETRRYNASLNVNYTLFDGFGRWYDYKRFKERSAQSELEVRQTIETTVLQLFSVYYEVARLEENAANLQEALTISRNRLERARYQFEFGQNTGLDVLNAEVDVNTDSVNLLNAQQFLRNTKRDLNLIMNRELTTAFAADTTVTFLPQLQIEDIMSAARENNIRMLLAEKDILISEYSMKATRSGYLPTIGLTGSYGWNESNNNSPLAFVLQNTSTNINGGVNVTWNLFDGGSAINNARNARITFENQELIRQQTELEVERDIQNAYGDYRNALFVLDVQDKNLQTNQDNFERSRERYQLGQITSIEFRQAQLNLLQAELARSQAKYNAKLAELQLLQVSGELLNQEF
ncbi:Outer membrane protein TolC [Robiginitalea myxolifaciens]|uniref:Outer membrane protein TolC n=1 Tax=Robiginitalea myxolifaciens TaxID=400055 RepID=A0A1I6GBL8_9FLAO|nr:TolC family protein [Robiginitalea myxolifaciens]SFR39585.1 Outer membrane protein TolC [Robiginitalea myxolifaciens]